MLLLHGRSLSFVAPKRTNRWDRIQYDDNIVPEGRRSILLNADSHIELMNEAFSGLMSDLRRDRNQVSTSARI